MKALSELDIESKKVIIFDLDGTTIDSIGMWNLTDYTMIKRYGGGEVPLKVIQDDRDYFLHNNPVGNIYVGYCNFLIQKYKLSIHDPSILSDERRDEYAILFENEVEFKPHAAELILKLKEVGKTLVLATMTTLTQLGIYSRSKKLIPVLNISEAFDKITTADMVKKKKPDPEIYKNVLTLCNVSPEECLVFEDSLTGVKAASDAGMEVVNIYDKYSDKDQDAINEIADYAITDYIEVVRLLEQVYGSKQMTIGTMPITRGENNG